jgi:hypothetical protein
MNTIMRIIVASIAILVLGGCSSLEALAPQTATPNPSETLVVPPTFTPAPPLVGTSIASTSGPITAIAITLIPSQLTPSARASTTPAPNTTKLIAPELRYKLIVKFGTLFFCDPDLYPVARQITDDQIAARVAEIQKDSDTYQSILNHNGLTGMTSLSIDQKRLIYADYKKLAAISLQLAGSNYTFVLRATESGLTFAYEGLVDSNGNITTTRRQQTIADCPICLTGETLIDTPIGPIAVRDLRRGMPVWTQSKSGEPQAVVILKIVKRELAFPYALIHLALSDGKSLIVSPGHPIGDGRFIGDLRAGDLLDGSTIVRAEPVWSSAGATYDILPAGETGLYWAGGILLESTLH